VRPGPFLPADLDALDGLLSRASAVAPMEDVADGLTDDLTIGLRHDCDNVIEPAVRMAEWEARRGYRSTYYILHTSPYWQDKPLLCESLDQIASYGHEIGIHNDAITVALETGRRPSDILAEAVGELRGYGHTIRSTVAHGNARCHVDHYVNDEMFSECYRPGYGGIDRLGFQTYTLAAFGLDFDANWLTRGDYLSDSGGQWSRAFADVAVEWPTKGQLHILQHPDWWGAALEPAEVAV
jgi:hypothetical protein